MALIQSYEVPGTGLSAPDAYFVVTDVKVQKRMQDIPLPPDNSTPTGLTNNGVRDDDMEVHWQAGYIAECFVTIWARKEAREAHNKPIGFAGVNATGAINHPKEASEILIDEKLNIITVPTYMMDVNIIEVYNGIENAITALRKVI